MTSSSRPRTASPTGMVIRPPVEWTGVAAAEAGGGLEGHCPDSRVIEVILHLRDQLVRLVPVNPDGVLDRRQPARVEGDVDDRPAQGDNPAVGWGGHGQGQSDSAIASGVTAIAVTRSARLTMPTSLPSRRIGSRLT